MMDLFSLLETLDRLKHLKRTGWINHGVEEPETVASHMYRMAVLAMTLAEHRSDLDMAKCVQMALVHDIGEAIIGDITPHCGVSEKEKQEIERNAVEEIAGFVPTSIGKNWLALWEEYEAAVTPEAKAVKQLDKFDMIAQALSYEQRYQMDLSEFFETTQNAFSEQPFLGWAKQVREKHSALMLAKHMENGRNDAGNN